MLSVYFLIHIISGGLVRVSLDGNLLITELKVDGWTRYRSQLVILYLNVSKISYIWSIIKYPILKLEWGYGMKILTKKVIFIS